jgi:ATP-dependent helicase/nuclease subunit A
MLSTLSAIATAEHPLLVGLNIQQAMAVQAPANKALKILAGAGTGKTELLARRFAYIVEQLANSPQANNPCPPSQRVMLMTFTDKAAQEMQARVNRYLQPDATSEEASQWWIGTFHQVATRILRQHAGHVGLTPTFTVLDASQQTKLVRQLLARLKQGDFADSTHTLAHHGLDAMAISAKTLSLPALTGLQPANATLPLALNPLLDSLPSLLAQIQATGQTPAQFWRSAHQETEALTHALKTLPLTHPYTNEPCSDLGELLRLWKVHLAPWADKHWDPLACEAETDQPTDSNYRKMLEGLLGKTSAPRWVRLDKASKTYVPVDADQLLAEQQALDETLVLEKAWIDVTTLFYCHYLDTLTASNALDFDGLLNRCVSLLSNEPSIKAHYQQQFEAVLVDEFQDSNVAQLRLIELLRRPTVDHTTANITVVGDEKQSIYGFRFAQAENLASVFVGLDTQTIYLRTNYRSHPDILAVANPLALALTEDPQQCLEAAVPNPMCNEAPVVTWLTLGEDQAKQPIENLRVAEADWIANDIAQYCQQHPTLSLSDIAIVIKTHAKAGRLQQALAQKGILSQCQRQKGLLQQPVIKTLIAALTVLLPTHGQSKLVAQQTAALVHILQSKLTDDTINHLLKQSSLGGLWAYCLQLSPDQSALGQLVQFFSGLSQALIQQPCSVRTVLGVLERLIEALLEVPTSPFSQQQQTESLTTIKMLINWLFESGEADDFISLMTVLSNYADDPTWEPSSLNLSNNDNQPSSTPAVQILTLHGSKGLEFSVVYVALTEASLMQADKAMPIRYQPQPQGKAGFGLLFSQWHGDSSLKQECLKALWLKPRQQAEVKRLFYVGLTRAKQRLVVLRALQTDAWTSQPAILNTVTD